MTVDPHDTQAPQPVELDDATLAAAGLQRTTAYVKTGPKKRKGSAERMARMREKKAAEGAKTKDQLIRELGVAVMEVGGQEVLELGRAVVKLKGFKRWLVMRWIADINFSD